MTHRTALSLPRTLLAVLVALAVVAAIALATALAPDATAGQDWAGKKPGTDVTLGYDWG